VSSYEDKILELAKHRNCQGIICGHIHTPADKRENGVHYLNSGDWVETMRVLWNTQTGGLSCFITMIF